VKKIDLIPGIESDGSDAAFCPAKMAEQNITAAMLSNALGNSLGGFATLLADGKGLAITIKGDDASLIGIDLDTAKTYTPEQVIAIIANHSATTAILAGVGGCETAGNIISTLRANPDLIDEYLANPAGTFIDRISEFRYENGSLSWHAQNGEIVTPPEMRAHLGHTDN